jgi:1,6-anhydro-N-acetylmuramate kinase
MNRLRAGIPDARVAVVDELGVDADALEAVLFAVLAVETRRGRPAALPRVAGPRRPAILAKIAPASPDSVLRR